MIDHQPDQRPAVTKAQNGPEISEYFNTFMSANPSTGTIVFEVHQDSPVRGRIPVPNALVTISRPLGGNYFISKVVITDENGETEPVELPTVSRERSLRPGEGRASTTYRASVEAPGYRRQDIYDIEIFDGITSVQHVDLQLNAGTRGNG